MVTTTTGLATSFITFTRTSNATVTDSNGFIEWAGHNLLTNSESFDASAWVKSSATVTANTDPAPNGTTTGDTIAASGANGTALQTWTAEAVPYTFGVWLRRKTGTGNIQIAADSGTYTTVTITSSWALYTVTQTPAAGSKSAGIRIVTSGDEVYAWGAHLYRSDLGGMVLNPARGDAYYPTTPRNLLGFTESLTTGWTNSNTTDSIVTETNPNGLASSVEVTATAGNGTLLGSLSLLASPYTFSIWLKRKTGTGTVEITVDGTTYVAAAVTGTWTRFSTTLTPTAGTKTPGIRLVTSGDAVFAWGAQLSDSASLDAYSPVYGAAVTSAAYYAPRLDYDPVTLAARGLLVEEQRTNSLQYSSEFDNAYWGKNKLNTTGIPAWVNVGVAPDGTLSAEKLIPNTTSAADHNITSTSVSSGNYTMSIYAKADGYSKLMLYDNGTSTGYGFDLSAGTTFAVSGISAASSPLIVPVGNNWYRCSIYATGGLRFDVYVLNDTSFSAYSGNGTGGVLVWGAQVEAGSFATSYIPNGSAVAGATRAADVASVSTGAFPYSGTAGSYVVAFTPTSLNNNYLALSMTDGTASNRIYTSVGPAEHLVVSAGGVLQASIDGGTLNNNVANKVAAAFAENDFAVSLNGGAAATDTSGIMPVSITTMSIGNYNNASSYMNGWVRQVTYLPRRISNAELQSRTA